MNKAFVILLALCFSKYFANSQNNATITDLKRVLNSAIIDTIKIKAAIELSDEFVQTNIDSAYSYAKMAETILKGKTNPKLEIKISMLLSELNASRGRDDYRLEYLFKALKIATKNNLYSEIANVSNSIADFYQQKNFKRVVEYYKMALNAAKKTKDKELINSILTSGSNYYFNTADYDKTKEIMDEQIKLNPFLKNDMLQDYGDLYRVKHDFVKARDYYFKAIQIFKERKDSFSLMILYNNYALIPGMEKNYDEAIHFNNISKKLALRFNQFDYAALQDTRIAELYFSKKDYISALKFNNEAREYYSKKGDIMALKDVIKFSSEINFELGNYKAAYYDQNSFLEYQKSIDNLETQNKIRLLESSIEEDKKQTQINLLNKDKEIQKRDIEKQRVFTIFIIVGLLLLLVFTISIFRSLKAKNRQNEIIEAQKVEIVSSLSNLELLNTISNEITSSLNIDKVMHLIYKNVSSIMDVSFFIISTYDKIHEMVEVKYCVKEGNLVNEVFETSISNPNSFTALTIKNKSEIVINDLEKEYSNWLPGLPQLHGKEDLRTETMVFIPLFIKDEVIGLFSVQSKKINAYTDNNIEILRSLSSVIAVALNNADSYTKLDIANVEILNQKNIIEKEKQRSDELLLNILPSEVAEELKETGSAKAKSFDNVTVLFTDFKNFTQASESLSPEGLVNEINFCYSEFDKIITKYGIEKIKTIGDSYMCAGGLPISNTTHPWDVVNAGLELQQFIINHKQECISNNKPYFELRLGIHTGAVVAGIVGIKKFAYDIWGDTVNTASRMESSGEVGKVNISSATYQLVKDKFICNYRGKVQAKNKGEIDMYFVEGKI